MTDQDDHPNTETSDDRWLEERLVTAFELLDADAELDLAGLCADRPELMPVVAEALGLRQALPELQDAASTAEPDSDRTGQLLADRYRLGEPIGRGAAGTVFEARDEQLGRDVAVKIVRSRLFGGVDAAQRFLREAHLLAQLAHRQVVRVHDMGATDDGDRFLVTELLHGQSLQTILATSQAVMADGPSAAAFGAARPPRARPYTHARSFDVPFGGTASPAHSNKII